MWLPDVDELINDDQAVGAAIYDELEDNDYMMMQAEADEDGAQRREHDEAADEGSGGDRDGGDGGGGRRAARSSDSAGGGQEGEWEEVMGECSEAREGTGHSPDDHGDAAQRHVGVGTARERAAPGKRRRVATLARWEPSARAHMLACLDDATIDVTGD